MSLLSGIIACSRRRSGGTPPPTTDYSNPGGSGDRRSIITMSSSLTPNASPLNNMVDGIILNSSGPWFNVMPNGATIEWDFGPPKIINEATFNYNVNVSFGFWQWQGWNGSSWVDIGSPTEIGGTGGTEQVITALSANVAYYAKYRILKTSGAGSNWFWNEMRFKIA